jgi:predicted nuclease of predicted toxin-antitoxin system
MLKFLIDEDMLRSTETMLKARGYEVLDVRDCGLRGSSDQEVFRFAQREGAIILSGDVGFGNLLHYPARTHCGIVVAHFPNQASASELNGQIAKALDSLTAADLSRNLVILEPGKIRIRRK